MNAGNSGNSGRSRPSDKGRGGGGGRPVIQNLRKGGAQSQKKFFPALRASFWSKNKAGGTPGPLPWSRHWGKGKGVPAMKAGVFVFRPPSSKLIQKRQLTIRDQSQVEGLILSMVGT